MTLTTAEYMQMLARLNRGGQKPAKGQFDAWACSDEGKLHDQIAEEAKRRGWLAIHSRMDKRSTSTLGCPDFIIFASKGRMFNIEAKTKNGKQRPEQKAVEMVLKMNGHNYFLVRSFPAFIALIGA